MQEYKTIEEVDASVLDRITEDEIGMWFAAKIHQLRAAGVNTSTMWLHSMTTQDGRATSWWTVFVDGQPGSTQTIAGCVEDGCAKAADAMLAARKQEATNV